MFPKILLSYAEHWSAVPYNMSDTATIFPGLDGHGIEDPSNIWADTRGNLHVVFHDHMAGGGHAFSRTGRTWQYSSDPAYTPAVVFEGSDTPVFLQRRERPHIVLDPKTLVPTHLSNGVQPPGKPASGMLNDYTYTLIQPISA